jgi:hypothetical protein
VKDEGMADRIQQYIREVYYDLNELDELQREEEVTTKELATKSEFEKGLNKLK